MRNLFHHMSTRQRVHNRGMKWRFTLFLLLGLTAFGDTVRLYLKDGTFQLAREYQVLEDRVRYLSAERGEWEEVPLELTDLPRTKKEAAERDEELKKETKEQDEEDAA